MSPIHTAQTTEDPSEKFIAALTASVESLFINNDYTSLFRICRSFIKKRPQLLHDALSKNHSDLLSEFIPVASIEILQQKNEVSESVLLHAIRLNRIEIIKVLLKKKIRKNLLKISMKKK